MARAIANLVVCLFVCLSPFTTRPKGHEGKPQTQIQTQSPRPKTPNPIYDPKAKHPKAQHPNPETQNPNRNSKPCGFGLWMHGFRCFGLCVGFWASGWGFGFRVSGFRFSGFGFVGWRLGLGVEGGSAMGWSSGPIVGRHLETLVPGTHKPRWVEYG